MKKTLLILTIIFISSCSQQENNVSELPETILAQINDENVSIDDVNEYLLNLPSNSRWVNSNQKEWLTNIITSLAVKKTIMKEAELKNLDNHPGYINASEKIERTLYSNYYIKQNNINVEISTEDLQNYYDQHIEQFNLPEQRVVHHIFKAYKTNKEQTISELNKILKRINKGENFMLLAEENSESETRHNEGLIGKVKKGDLSPDFDNIIFNLEKSSPSEIIHTKEGAHIFMVLNILKEIEYPFSAVKTKIQKQLHTEKSLTTLKELALKLPESKDYFLMSLENLQKVSKNQRSNPRVAEVGDFKLSLNSFAVELNEVREPLQGIDIKNLPYMVLQEIVYRQIIFEHMKNNMDDYEFSEIFKAELENQKSEKKLEIFSNLRLYSYLNENPEIINEYFKENEMRFSSAILLDLQLLEIPMQNNEDIMPLLEKSVVELDNGKLTINDLAEQYSGTIKNLNNKNIVQLYNINSKVLKQVFDLNIGDHSSPYTDSNAFYIVRLMKKVNAKKRTLLSVREKVVKQYVQENSSYIYSLISNDILKNIELNNSAIEMFLNNH